VVDLQDEAEFSSADREAILQPYFHIFPWHDLPSDSVGIDVGCGSGRWSVMVAPRSVTFISSTQAQMPSPSRGRISPMPRMSAFISQASTTSHSRILVYLCYALDNMVVSRDLAFQQYLPGDHFAVAADVATHH
jgi:hypothetical protein